jgi:hypothetical protein
MKKKLSVCRKHAKIMRHLLASACALRFTETSPQSFRGTSQTYSWVTRASFLHATHLRSAGLRPYLPSSIIFWTTTRADVHTRAQQLTMIWLPRHSATRLQVAAGVQRSSQDSWPKLLLQRNRLMISHHRLLTLMLWISDAEHEGLSFCAAQLRQLPMQLPQLETMDQQQTNAQASELMLIQPRAMISGDGRTTALLQLQLECCACGETALLLSGNKH